MKRKLVQQGASTLMVSLPSKWVHQHNLTKGSEVNIESLENNLLIAADSIELKKEKTIYLQNSIESSVRTLITTVYRSGYDRILVFFDDEKQFQQLTNIIKTRLIGFEIIKKEKKSCIVENITEPSADQFDTIFKKMLYNITELFETTKKRTTENIPLKEIEEIQERIQRYDNFCRRIIIKKKVLPQHTEVFWNFLTLLIHGQREIYHLNRLYQEKIIISQKTIDLLSDAQELFNLIKESYLEKNIALLAKIHSAEKELIYKKGYALLQQKSGKENIIIYHLLSSIRQFYQANSPLTGLLVD